MDEPCQHSHEISFRRIFLPHIYAYHGRSAASTCPRTRASGQRLDPFGGAFQGHFPGAFRQRHGTSRTGPGSHPPDYSQEAYVVERYLQRMRFENDGTGRDETEAQIKIVSESGVQALGQLKVGYSALSDKLEIAYVRVRKPDGTVVNAQESAIQDLTFPDAPVYTDYHEKHISVPSLRPGDVLEYRYVRTIASPLTPGQFWTSYNFAEKELCWMRNWRSTFPKTARSS